MTTSLPCPFCGHTDIVHSEGSTFRWLATSCNGCGAQCGETRINTLTMERIEAMKDAEQRAVIAWNTRAEQQARKPLTDEQTKVLFSRATQDPRSVKFNAENWFQCGVVMSEAVRGITGEEV